MGLGFTAPLALEGRVRRRAKELRCARKAPEEHVARGPQRPVDLSDLDFEFDGVEDEQDWDQFTKTFLPNDGSPLPTYEEYRQRVMEERERRVPKPYYHEEVETQEEADAARASVDELREKLIDGPSSDIFQVFAPHEDPRTELSRLERSRDQARQFRASVMHQLISRMPSIEARASELLPDSQYQGSNKSIILLTMSRLVADKGMWDAMVTNPPELAPGDPRQSILASCISVLADQPHKPVQPADDGLETESVGRDSPEAGQDEKTAISAATAEDDGFTEFLPADEQPVLRLEDALAANLLFAAVDMISREYESPEAMKNVSDALEKLRHPWNWFSGPRRTRRRVVIHSGPTNAGKTYNCLEKLSASSSGVYIAPARLLAWEVRDRLDFDFATRCSLHAVHDVRVLAGARHDAWAVDAWVLDPERRERRVDVAVIDEAHEIDNPEMGWMIAKAILNVKCAELHVCLDPMAIKVISRMLEEAGDEVDFVHYKRMAPLSLPETPFKGRVEELQKGDCVVTPSMQDVYRLRARIERNSEFKVSVLHEGMSSRSLREDVEMFNRGQSEILVSTQAVGMGLNLNISRVMFWEIQKTDGVMKRPFSHLELRQIAGRAGRYVSEFSQGMVCVRDRRFLKPVRSALGQAPDSVELIRMLPSSEVIEEFRGIAYRGGGSEVQYDEVLEHLAQVVDAEYSGRYVVEDLVDVKGRLRLLEGVTGLSPSERWQFCTTGLDVLNPIMSKTVIEYATRFEGGDGAIACGFDERILQTPESLQDLEDLTSVIDTLKVYQRLSVSFPQRFTEYRYAAALAEDGRRLLQDST